MSIVVLAVVILGADRLTKEVVLRNHEFGQRRHGIVRLVFTERPLLTRGTSLRMEVVLWCAAVACAVSAVLCAPTLQHNLFATAGSLPPCRDHWETSPTGSSMARWWISSPSDGGRSSTSPTWRSSEGWQLPAHPWSESR